MASDDTTQKIREYADVERKVSLLRGLLQDTHRGLSYLNLDTGRHPTLDEINVSLAIVADDIVGVLRKYKTELTKMERLQSTLKKRGTATF